MISLSNDPKNTIVLIIVTIVVT